MPHEIRSPSTSSATHDEYDAGDIFPDHVPPDEATVAADRRQTRKRAVIIVVSFVVLVAAVALIAFSGMFRPGSGQLDSGQNDNPNGRDAALVRSKIQALCAVTDFQDLCVSSIVETSGLQTVNLKKLILCSTKVAIAAVQKACEYSAGISNNRLDSRTASSFRDCDELLTYARDELNASYVDIDNMHLISLPFKMPGILSSLSAAIAFQQTCTDGLPGGRGDLTVTMRALLKNATEATRNNLAIVSGYPSQQEEATRVRSLLDAIEGEAVWYVAKGKPDAVVAQDGSGDYQTIGDALKAALKERNGRFVIYVKEGVYKENVRVTREMRYVTMYGDGADRTVVIGSKGFADGVSVYGSATFAVSGAAFMARDMGFKNTAGPEKAQAVALRVESDLSVIYNCTIDSYQSTLFAHAHRQFYRDCIITGTIDIINGDAAAIFQNCEIVVKKPLPGQPNTVAAHTRIDEHEPTGIVAQNCTISPAADLFPVKGLIQSYLGRPVKEFSLTVIMQSKIDDVIRPEGWAPSIGNVDPNSTATAFLGEFRNSGPGADLDRRVSWPAYHVLLDVADVSRFTVEEFIMGPWWLKMTGVPFYTGVN
ncbi:pectinesterase-like [Magnolia sinica]|uniref:pectinesterase-like n=1 Tax=Magnolia sinica TaxID=86752 RepID=UPI00265976B3|nr:pectinesterase-like [Magnolia sinica]